MSSMQQLKLLALIIPVMVVAMFGGSWLATYLKDRTADAPADPVLSTTFNPNAPISEATGDPFPANAAEDLVVELFYLDASSSSQYSVVAFRLDYPLNWQVELTDAEGTLIMRKVGDAYFAKEDIDNIWFSITEDQSRELFDADQFLLDDELLGQFASVAEQRMDEQCNAANCAVWEAEDFDNGELLTIRVDKITRRISSVTGLNDLGLFNMAYSYQPVDLAVPELNQ